MVESSPCIVEGLPFVSTIRATLIPPGLANFAFILLHLDGERLNNTFHTYISHLIASGTTVTLGYHGHPGVRSPWDRVTLFAR